MPKVKVYKVEIMVVDFDDVGEADIRDSLEDLTNAQMVGVMDSEVKSVQWDDDNPLNNRTTRLEAFRNLFRKSN